jgi:HlyD family secretion protein
MNPPTLPLSFTEKAEAPTWNGALDHDSPFMTNPPLAFIGNHSARVPVSSRRPRSNPWTRARKLWAVAGTGVALFVVLMAGMSSAGKLLGKARYSGPTWTVPKERLKVAIIERGTLESAKNGDIICTVRSGTKGSTIATTIKWIIEPGVQVVKGDKLVELDSSGFVEQLKDQRIKVDQAKATWVTANEEYHIQESQNESDIEAAKNTRDLARIDLEKYEKAEFAQALEDVDGRLNVARADVAVAEARSTWANRMYSLGYMSKAQAKGDESRTDALLISLKKLETEKRVLVDFMKRRTIQELSAKLAEAKRALDRVKIQSRAKLVQADADRVAKDSVYNQELSRVHEIEAEIGKCRVAAPQDGLVVYYVSDQARSGGGSQQSIVAQGEPVREGQKMMQIPDLSQMVVNVRIHEAMVSNLRNEKDPRDKSTWQVAQIRIDAVPNRILRGHVKTVDTVAGQQDWFASDVKLYKTVVSIDEPVEGLKPGMSAEVTIYADESPTDVMVVPVQAIVGTISLGANPKCYVVGTDGQPEPRDILVGMSNQRVVEVKSGLKEGDMVVLNPASLLALDGETKRGKAGSKNEDDAQHSDGERNDGTKTRKK